MQISVLWLTTFFTFVHPRPNAHVSSKHGPERRFTHPGALHTVSDIHRVKIHVKNHDEPWYKAYQHLSTRTLAQPTWISTPQSTLVRGVPDGSLNLTQNYGYAYRDAHSAYQLALRWLITDNTTFADAAIRTLDGWGSTLRDINGNEDMYGQIPSLRKDAHLLS